MTEEQLIREIKSLVWQQQRLIASIQAILLAMRNPGFMDRAGVMADAEQIWQYANEAQMSAYNRIIKPWDDAHQ